MQLPGVDNLKPSQKVYLSNFIKLWGKLVAKKD